MLEVTGVSKRYEPVSPWLRPLVRTASRETVEALRDVSLSVERGQVVGLVGPNGAGKTTLLKIVATLLEPDAGVVRIDGHDVVADPREVWSRIGLVLPEERGLYWRLTGMQNLEFFGGANGMSPSAARRRGGELMDLVGLSGRDKLVFGYSSGMRARLSLARALLTDPPLLVLDEPTRALDPLASVEVARYLRSLADDGHAVLLSSHRLDEVASTCDVVAVLLGGQLRWVGPTSDLSTGAGVPAAIEELLAEDSRA